MCMSFLIRESEFKKQILYIRSLDKKLMQTDLSKIMTISALEKEQKRVRNILERSFICHDKDIVCIGDTFLMDDIPSKLMCTYTRKPAVKQIIFWGDIFSVLRGDICNYILGSAYGSIIEVDNKKTGVQRIIKIDKIT